MRRFCHSLCRCTIEASGLDVWISLHDNVGLLQALIAAVPAETIDAWMSALPPLHPRRLMPALMRSGNGSELCCSHADALRYMEFCLSQLKSTDTTVHNLAVSSTIGLNVSRLVCRPSTYMQALHIIDISGHCLTFGSSGDLI